VLYMHSGAASEFFGMACCLKENGEPRSTPQFNRVAARTRRASWERFGNNSFTQIGSEIA